MMIYLVYLYNLSNFFFRGWKSVYFDRQDYVYILVFGRNVKFDYYILKYKI